MVKPEFREEMTAVRQVQRLGYDPRDVRRIVLTHLNFDHAGGLDDFPGATVHLMEAEREYAFQQLTWQSDDYFYHAAMEAHPRCTPGLRFYQLMIEKNRSARPATSRAYLPK